MKFYSPNRKKMNKKTQATPKKQVLNSLNFELKPEHKEKSSPEIVTVPDQTPELKDLLQKGQQGYSLPVRDGQYTSVEIPDLELMDTIDLLMYREDLAEHMAQLKDEHHQFTKELEQRKLDEDFQQKFDEELKKRQAQKQEENPPKTSGQEV